MKTPIAYYGGKQQLASRIIGLIPEHRIYVEPFFGGGAVFWAKEPSEVEIVNDTNGELINFYRVLRQNADALIKEIDATLNSRETYRHAEVVLRNADMFDEVKRAWAVWVVSNMAYCHKWFAGWGYQLSVRQAIANARDRIGGGGYGFAVLLPGAARGCSDRMRRCRFSHHEDGQTRDLLLLGSAVSGNGSGALRWVHPRGFRASARCA